MGGHGSDHLYRATLAWDGSDGSTGGGYTAYTRDHEAAVPPATEPFALSADPHFRGDATRANPEQLLVLAASSCQLLSFLHVAATARLDVLDYTDDAEGLMPADSRPMRITRITLRPRVLVAADSDVSRFEELMHEAHESCFIANSLTTEIVLEPTVEIAPKEQTA
ncbi:osmotically inducible protein OsmC [Knoellia sinensis KCTC 19936]|uniref:Osmotically inducible protein OsmC n=1 Tax=Knoellia sinensis KCTC 19936 TaxID=1385520 RepID=A0A0A0J8R6_9MICO|nr:OsmC family protein [Knoellia sinensis]KGN33159.1 osmotically inducible protein OsmC [Knoellia sinensis KCTC 19936]